MVRHWYEYETLASYETLANLLENGLCIKEICDIVGCSDGSFRAACCAHNINYKSYPQFEKYNKKRGRRPKSKNE